MQKNEKVILIGGGVAVAALLLFAAAKRAHAQRIAALNQPGLMYSSQTAYAADTGLAQIIAGGASGISSWLAGAFQNSGSSNDPGLEGSTAGDYAAGAEYDPGNADPYGANFSTSDAASFPSDSFDPSES